jgi:hypothetical protein
MSKFKQQYPHPLMTGSIETSIPGLKIIFVFDKSEQASDPIIPDAWIKLKNGKIIEHSNKGIRESLQLVGFNPQSEQEALSACLISFMDDYYHGKLVYTQESEKQFQEKVSPALIEQLKLQYPRVVKEGPAYLVELYVFYEISSMRFFKQEAPQFIYFYRFKVGLDIYEILEEKLIGEQMVTY